MGKGKSHHRGGRTEESNTDHSTSNILNMDPDAPYRSTMLFYNLRIGFGQTVGKYYFRVF